MLKFTKKLLPSALIAVAAGLLSASCFVISEDGGLAMVRFTWETTQAQRGNIQEIIAGYEDVKQWYDYVYRAPGGVMDDFTDIPLYSGSYDIRDKIYSDLSPQDAAKYKGVYLPISQGSYTAVCTVNDTRFNRVYDIVANYKIREGDVGAVKYYEVAFDVKSFLAGDDDYGWFFDEYDDPYTDPRLRKAASGGLVKEIERDGVVYRVFRRPGGVNS